MNPTPEQRTAIETQDRALVVEAGAGTGKTWVLVQRFLYLLETHDDWPLESIVAITFTEKAAREMRTRLRQGIETHAREKPEDRGWQIRRMNLDRLRVSTIHSLCARLLRENAIPAGLDPLFRVLDEQEADLLKEEAIRSTLQALDEAGNPALEILASLRVYDLRNEMEAMLGKRGTLYPLFSDLAEPEEILGRWRDGLAAMRADLWAQLVQDDPLIAEALEALPGVEIVEATDNLATAVMAGQRGCRSLAAGDLIQAAQEWETIRLTGGRQANWGGKEAMTEIKAYLKALREGAKALDKAGALQAVGAADEQAAVHLQLWRMLWEVLERTYQEIKRRTQAVDFDDLELMTVQILEENPRAARLERSLAEINHLMVDEFQDTNLLQQRIVYALAPVQAGGRLFVVGDAKQSIYRFRQAQVSVFNRTAAEVKAVTGSAACRLSTSFRSHQALVRAANQLFAKVLKPLGETYEDYEARPGALEARRPTPAEYDSPVTVHLVAGKDPDGKTILAEEARMLEAQWIGRYLLGLKEAGFQVWDKGRGKYRPFDFRDAALLFRATTQLPLYEAAFKRAGLPYLTVSGRGYYDRPEVQDLISLLTALANPDDDLSLAAALRSPLFSLSDETLYRLRRVRASENGDSGEVVPLRLALATDPQTDQLELVMRANEILTQLWNFTNRVAVWRLVREALDLSGYEAVLAMADGETGRQRSNVQKFMALARERGGTSLPDFLGRLRDLKAQEAREGEALGKEPESGAVQLMSIHASKGLEYPVVVVADMGRQNRGGFGSAYLLSDPAYGLVCKVRDAVGDWQKPAGYAWGEWLHKRMEEAESKRLLYVACTRAADILVLSGQAGKKGSWLAEVMDAWEIEAEGAPETRKEGDDYTVRVIRSSERLEGGEVRPDGRATAAGMVVIPALAQVYKGPQAKRVVAVSHLREEEREVDQPMIWGLDAKQAGRGVSGRTVGRMVHQALADWEGLSSPEGELLRRLEVYARQEGVSLMDMGGAVQRVFRMVGNLKRHRLYQEIQKARQHYTEVPFSLVREEDVVHGVIDMLWEDPDGGWHLVDWKTEWCPREVMAERAEAHREQMATYSQAVERLLGVKVKAEVCFLWPGVGRVELGV